MRWLVRVVVFLVIMEWATYEPLLALIFPLLIIGVPMAVRYVLTEENQEYDRGYVAGYIALIAMVGLSIALGFQLQGHVAEGLHTILAVLGCAYITVHLLPWRPRTDRDPPGT